MIFYIVLATVLCLAVFAIFRRKNKFWVYGRPLLETDPEVVIVGSGTLGTALAIVLARDGRRVTVIERALVPLKRIVGEYLQPGGVKAMEELGLDSCFDDFEWVHGRGFIVHDHKLGKIRIEFPCKGKSFFNCNFVLALRRLAQKEEKCTFIEANVIQLIRENGVVKGVTYKTKQGNEENVKDLYAPLTVVADGHFSRLRKGIVNGPVRQQKHLAGMLFPEPIPFEDEYIHGFTTETSVLFYNPIANTNVRMLAVVDRATCGNIKEHLLDKAPHISEHAREAYRTAVKEGTTESCLCQTLTATPSMEPGVLALGDAFSMAHPITGAGMSIALYDVIFWRKALRKIPDLRDYDAFLKALRAFIWNRKKYTFTANIYSLMMLGMFIPHDQLSRDVREYALRYIRRGGECHDAPARIYALMDTRPLAFLWLVCLMTKHAMEMAMKEEPRTVRGLHKAVTILYNTITGLVPLIWAEVKTVFVF